MQSLNLDVFWFQLIIYTLHGQVKENDYRVMLHQLDKNLKIKQSILFLSHCLNTAEQEYWLTELKTDALVWTLIKLLQYFDQDQFTVYTDHSALKSALQTKTKS